MFSEKRVMSHILRLFFTLLVFCLPHAAGAAETVKIGVTVSMSGKYSELGSMVEKAYRLWEADVNRKGGMLGKPVKLSILDDRSNPNTAAELYRRMIVEDKVDLLLGPYSSEITEAVAAVAEQYQQPLLAAGGSADSIWQQGRKFVFGVYVISSKYPAGFLEVVVRSGIKNIAIVSADDVFSRNVEAGIREWAKRYQLNIVASEQFKKGSTGIDNCIQAARTSNADALMVAGHFDDAVNARKALKKLRWTPKAYYATVGPAIPKYFEALKEDANGTFSSSQWEPDLPYPGSREFAKSFSDAYQVTPSYQSASAYAAGQILEAAVRKAKTLDRLKLRDALSTLDTITVIGRYGVDHEGRQVRHFTTTVQWQNGRKQIVAPQELATAKPVWR